MRLNLCALNSLADSLCRQTPAHRLVAKVLRGLEQDVIAGNEGRELLDCGSHRGIWWEMYRINPHRQEGRVFVDEGHPWYGLVAIKGVTSTGYYGHFWEVGFATPFTDALRDECIKLCDDAADCAISLEEPMTLVPDPAGQSQIDCDIQAIDVNGGEDSCDCDHESNYTCHTCKTKRGLQVGKYALLYLKSQGVVGTPALVDFGSHRGYDWELYVNDCGYVHVGEDHPWYGKHPHEIKSRVWGGTTYAHEGRIGFDNNHTAPFMGSMRDECIKLCDDAADCTINVEGPEQ